MPVGTPNLTPPESPPPTPRSTPCPLLLRWSVHAVHDATQPDVEQPDLGVQLVDLLLQGAGPATAAPEGTHGPRHEVHRHDEAQRQHSALRVPLELLQDVEAGHGEEEHAHRPEEAAEHRVQQVVQAAQEEGQAPVRQQHGGHQQQGAGRGVGQRGGAEVVAHVGGWARQGKVSHVVAFQIDI